MRAGSLLRSLTLSLLACAAPALPQAVIARDDAATAARKLEKAFQSVDETLEYHFMLKVPALTEANRSTVFADLAARLRPILKVGELSGPRTGAYIDSKERPLGKARLVVRLRPGQLTIRARSTSLDDLIDLQPCTGQKVKYEKDYFEDAGYSVSSEYKFKKEEWPVDAPRATVAQVMAFMQDRCPLLLRQLEPHLRPIEAMAAPGVAQMYAADIELSRPQAVSFKSSGFSLWLFPGTTRGLAEIAWTGRVKDKAALDELAAALRLELGRLRLLADDQSSKTEQYFGAYFGSP